MIDLIWPAIKSYEFDGSHCSLVGRYCFIRGQTTVQTLGQTFPTKPKYENFKQ